MSEKKKGLPWPALRPYFSDLAHTLKKVKEDLESSEDFYTGEKNMKHIDDAERQLLDLDGLVRDSLSAYGRLLRKKSVAEDLNFTIRKLEDELAQARLDAEYWEGEHYRVAEREEKEITENEKLEDKISELESRIEERQKLDEGEAGKIKDQIQESRNMLLRWVEDHDADKETLEIRRSLEFLERVYPTVAEIG